MAELAGIAELTIALDELLAVAILLAELVKHTLVVRKLAGHSPFA